MKTIKLLILAVVLAVFTFSAQAQEKESDKSAKDKKSASSKKSADKTDRKYLVGSRGGCYHLTESGKKNYVDKKYCEGVTTTPASDSKTPDAAPAAPAAPEADSKTNTPATNNEKTENKPNEKAPAAAPESSDPNPSDTTSSPKNPAPASDAPDKKKSDTDGRTYIKGSRGGCYYLTGSGKKVYVKDKSLCGN